MGSSFILILVYKLELAEAEKERFLPSSNTFSLSSIQDNLNVNIQRAESLNPIFWSNFNVFFETRVWAWKDQQNLVISF